MDHNDPSWRTVHSACKNGNIDTVRRYFEAIVPSTPSSHNQTDRSNLHPPTSPKPTTLDHTALTYLLTAAAEGNHPSIFAYIWDNFPTPQSTPSIPWPCLKVAAYSGSTPLAQVFWARDADCFNRTAPLPVIGPTGRDGHQQFNIAIRNDRFEYIDFMIKHGGDINAGLQGGNDLLKMVVDCAVEDTVTVRRVRFLVERGVEVRKSIALWDSVRGGATELARVLLECGADVDAVPTPEAPTCLAIAEREGYGEMIRLLREYGAK